MENHLALGRLDEAQRWLEAQLGATPDDPWTVSLLGTWATRSQRHEAAQGFFARAVQLDPKVTHQRYANGNWHASRGDHARALWEYHAVVTMDPSFAGAFYAQGVAYAALGRTQEARQSFESYLRFDATSEWADKARQELARLH